MSSTEGKDDPYEILGVSRNATASEIKSAYRKLALKFHPDKQRGSEEEKAKSSAIFTKIGNAYEILSDEDARKRFDAGQFFTNSGSSPSSSRYHRQQYRQPSPFDSDSPFSDPFFSDPFFNHGRSRSQRHQQAEFTDPFELFNRVFANEFGVHQNSHRGRSMFDEDPFFSSDPFQRMGGGFGGFGMMDQMMSSMMQNQRDMFSAHPRSENNGMRQFSSTSYSSSSRGGGGVRESVSTRTVVINGKKKVITERTKLGPNGKVERHVETNCDDDFPNYLEDGQNRNSNNSELQRWNSSRRTRK